MSETETVTATYRARGRGGRACVVYIKQQQHAASNTGKGTRKGLAHCWAVNFIFCCLRHERFHSFIDSRNANKTAAKAAVVWPGCVACTAPPRRINKEETWLVNTFPATFNTVHFYIS